MPLILTLIGGSDASASKTFDAGTLSIGRAASNDWMLPDPDRLISKTHCFVAFVDGRYVLTDVSSNGVFMNGSGERIPQNGQVELADGDEFKLGKLVVRVSENGSRRTSPPYAADPYAVGHAPLTAGGVRRTDPLTDAADLAPDPFGGDDLGADPFDEAGSARARVGFAHPVAAVPAQTLRNSDPFDLADEAKPAARVDDDDDDLLQGIRPAEQWKGPSQADNADAPMHAYSAPKALVPMNLDDLDIDALLGDEPPGAPPAALIPAAAPQLSPPPVAAQAPPHTADPFDGSLDDLLGEEPPAARGAAEPVAEPPPAVVTAAPGAIAILKQVVADQPAAVAASPVASFTSADTGRLLAAFLEGAGVPGLAVGADQEAAMRAAGAVFGAMVDGLRQVLISRASIKNEFRVEQTMLRSRDNNALKFSVTTEDAVAALLQTGRPGYKPPLDATREAFDDVRSHEMAVMAGVQTALIGLLKRFEPSTLESRLQTGTLGGFLPAARKARTWELFCATYKEIVREAEGDFLSVFGREFARAYDAQTQKL